MYISVVLSYFCSQLFSLFALWRRSERLDQIANVFLHLAVLIHGVLLGLYISQRGEIALSDRFSVVSLWLLLVSTGYLIYQFKYSIRYMGIFYLFIPYIFWLLSVDGSSLQPAVQTTVKYSLAKNLHALFSVSSLSFLTLSFISSFFYLKMRSKLKQKKLDFWFYRLPALNMLDQMSYLATLIGFLLMTLSIFSGAVQHRASGFTFFHMGTREYMIFLAWAAYILYFHIRFSMGSLGKRLAIIAMISYIIQVLAIFGMVGVHRF